MLNMCSTHDKQFDNIATTHCHDAECVEKKGSACKNSNHKTTQSALGSTQISTTLCLSIIFINLTQSARNYTHSVEYQPLISIHTRATS